MENYLTSYRHLIKEVETAMSRNVTTKSKISKSQKIKFLETPEKLVLEKNGVKIYYIDRPKYGLMTHMLKQETDKLDEAKRKYRTLVYSFIYEMDVDYSFERITEIHKDIESIKRKIAMLEQIQNNGKLFMLLREPNVNVQTNSKSNSKTKSKSENSETGKDNKKIMTTSKPPKMGKISKETLKNTLTTGKISESDMKVFLFKTLKECIARPNANNNAISKDKLIERMLENPNLRKRLPPSYANKKKEELCKILFPGSD